LAILLSQAREHNIPLAGCALSEILGPVPKEDLRRAMRECLPALSGWLKGDERNVILTFARIWLTTVTGEFRPKDAAAEWAIPRLPKEQAALLECAAKAYRGEYTDQWEGLDSEVEALVNTMKREIESCLDIIS
jgi:aminoglycoside 9-adenylyltransferase